MESDDKRTFVILFDVADDHSIVLAQSFRDACSNPRIFLKDPSGKAFCCDGGVRWFPENQSTKDLTQLLRTKVPGLGAATGFAFHMQLFTQLLALGIVVHPYAPGQHGPARYSGTKRGLNYLDKRQFNGTAYSTFDADQLVQLIGPDELLAHLGVGGCDPADVCFAMPPCGFNRLPSYILDFSHKLQINDAGDGLDYVRSTSVEEDDDDDITWDRRPAKELAPEADVLKALVDIALCRLIFTCGFRFYGTCHGAQAMWLALGQRVTRHSRYLADSPLETDAGRTLGVSGGEVKVTRGGLQSAVSKGNHLTAPPSAHINFAYSTDFNHEHFMYLPDPTLATQLKWKVVHPLASINLQQNLLQIIENPKANRATRKLLSKHDEFVQSYALNKIFCFQDHPHYHLTDNSVSQGRSEGKNPHAKGSRRVLEEVIWQ